MSTPNPSRSRGLGAELRRARNDAGLTQGQVAELLGKSVSYVSRCETGKLLASVEDTATMLTRYGVAADERERLVQMARDAADPNWVMPGMDAQLAALIEDEKLAEWIVNVEPLIIPGLLQTEEYARSIMVGAGATRGQADQRVLVRMSRQKLLTSNGGPRYLAIVGAQALQYPQCEISAMPKQLRHLLRMGKRANVTILVLPFAPGYNPALEGPFVLMGLPRYALVVQLEHYRSTTTITGPDDVRDYQAAVEDIRRKSLSEAESISFIDGLLKEMERRS